MSSKRVLLADDHEIIRAGIRKLLEEAPDCELVGEASSGREAVELARSLRPDVIVMDIGMPELNGLGATQQILEEVPGAEILILTVHESAELIRDVLAAGARGYILKSDANRHLLEAVDALSRHEPFFTSSVAEVVLAGFLSEGSPPSRQEAGRLTPRQLEILQLLAEGRTNRDIASVLGISIKTVETHRTNIMKKLDLHSVTELVRYAVRHKIIDA